MINFNMKIRAVKNRINRKRLKNKNFSLICNNCNGSYLLHELNQRYLSPTVDLYILPDEFIRFLQNLERYTSAKLEFSDEKEAECGFPVGVLCGDVCVYFMHYKSRESAEEKWVERSKRINFDNLFIMFTARDGYTYQNLIDFDNLPYKNKVIFTNKKYPDIKSAYYISGFENQEDPGVIFYFRGRYFGRRYYDDFPYIKWFNGKPFKSRNK